MFSLTQSIRAMGDAGDPLPTPFNAIERAGTKLYRGQVSLTSAGGGTGKSAFWLVWMLKARIPTLYFSADSDAFIQTSRAISALYQVDMEEAMSAVRRKQIAQYALRLDQCPIRFNYNASPSLDDIENSLRCWYELYNEYPHCVIVDNVTNVRTGGEANAEDPFAGLEALMDYLNTMARETGAHVAAMHHTTGPYNDGDKPIPKSGVKGQVTRVPALVFTLHKPSEDTLAVSVVKDRSGRSDATGSSFVELRFDGQTMQITDDVFLVAA
ncbi:AAA family ATPase [Streptomyces cacaoi]|uniref:Uncharacterized protein n=1 Tax=Streptomyces cacaoi TaxID=1898 RepID=A0A4Y3QY79_STRCI|nr:AAA family ATPase [Streptomyces cacaoi]GEB50406.1 hypothetical protein SCA03_29570 [Streptomyces cacaoi]